MGDAAPAESNGRAQHQSSTQNLHSASLPSTAGNTGQSYAAAAVTQTHPDETTGALQALFDEVLEEEQAAAAAAAAGQQAVAAASPDVPPLPSVSVPRTATTTEIKFAETLHSELLSAINTSTTGEKQKNSPFALQK